MQMILDDIHSLDGVSSVFFYNPNGDITTHQSKSEYSDEALLSVGQIFEKCFSWSSELFADVEKFVLQFDQCSVSAVPAGKSGYLVVIHESSLDADLLHRRIALALSNGDPQSFTGAGARPTMAQLEGMLESEPVKGILSSLENALNKVMGPIAAIVFNDTRNAWLNRIDQLNQASLDELIQMLCVEVRDPGKIETFKSLIASSRHPQ